MDGDTFLSRTSRTYSFRSFNTLLEFQTWNFLMLNLSRYGGSIRAYFGNNVSKKKYQKRKKFKNYFSNEKRHDQLEKKTKKLILDYTKKWKIYC